MIVEELTPEAVAMLKNLVHNPPAIENGPLPRLLRADRLVMGSPNKVDITQQGGRLLAQYQVQELQ